MKSKKDTKKIQVKQKKKTRKNQTNKRKTKKESCKIGSGRTYRKRRRSQKTCAICLEKIRKSDLIETECKHSFHVDCLKQWCDKNRRKPIVPCPYCRQSINETCSDIHEVDYEVQFEEGQRIPPMVNIPRWYTGNVFPERFPTPESPEDSPPYAPISPPLTPPFPPPETPEGSPPSPMSVSTITHFIPQTPSESPNLSPDDSTMDVVEIIEPLQPNIPNSLSPIQAINPTQLERMYRGEIPAPRFEDLSMEERRLARMSLDERLQYEHDRQISDEYDETLMRLHRRLRQ